MGNFVWDIAKNYQQYLYAQGMVEEVSHAISTQTRHFTQENSPQALDVIEEISSQAYDIIEGISDQTREIIASNRILAYELNRFSDQSNRGFANVSAGISELNASFRWHFGKVIAEIGHMNDSLMELIKFSKTPVQTVAFNHFEIARDAYNQALFMECLEELDKAISGDHTSPGYKLEWRFYKLKGVIQLGFSGGDLSLMDLAGAEESFLLAGRYAKANYPKDAAQAFLSAGWAAYCQGKMTEALSHTKQAISIDSELGEAFFQAAKISMATNDVETALSMLGNAINLDRFYALKASGDGDFQKFDNQLHSFLESLRDQKYFENLPKADEVIKKVQFGREHSPNVKNNEELIWLKKFAAEGMTWPLFDVLEFISTLEKTIASVEQYIELSEQYTQLLTRARNVLKENCIWREHSPDAATSSALKNLEKMASGNINISNSSPELRFMISEVDQWISEVERMAKFYDENVAIYREHRIAIHLLLKQKKDDFLLNRIITRDTGLSVDTPFDRARREEHRVRLERYLVLSEEFFTKYMKNIDWPSQDMIKEVFKDYIHVPVRNYTSLVKSIETTHTSKKIIQDTTLNFGNEKGVSIEFCHIPAGTIMMKDYIRENDHTMKEGTHEYEATLKNDFFLSKYPITIAQQHSITNDGDYMSQFSGTLEDQKEQYQKPYTEENWQKPYMNDWEGALKFVKYLNDGVGWERYFIPTIEQWKYACMAGASTKYFFGDDLNQLGEYAWFEDNSERNSHPVGQKKANAWGLHDMYGNISEFCHYNPHNYPASENSRRYLIGGSRFTKNIDIDKLESENEYYELEGAIRLARKL